MVACPADLVREVLLSLDPELDVDALPPDLAALLIEAALTPMIEVWERACGAGVALLGVERADAPVGVAGLHMLLAGGLPGQPERAWAAHLSGRTETETALLAFWPATPRAMEWLGLQAALRIGATRLPRRVLASLRPGDAVLLETRVETPTSAVLVVAEAWTALAQQDANGWRLAEAPGQARRQGRGAWTMDGDDASGRPPAAAGPDEIPVTLTFDVGRLELPLGELRRLGVGSVLELGRGVGELVEIAAHGRLIGRGELVEVDGAIAVRIVRLFDHG